MSIDEECRICALPLVDLYCEKVSCSHQFHYECLLKTYISCKRQTYKHTNRCPYCRSGGNYLPLLNGTKKMYTTIHKIDNNFQNIPCSSIIQRGPNKGNPCGKNCHIGFSFCKMHLKRELKK